MHEIRLDQEVERPVDGRRGGSFTLLAQRIKYVVCAYRLVAVPDQLKDPASDTGKTQSTIPTDAFCRQQGLIYAVAMIVLRRREWIRCRHWSQNLLV